MKTKFNDFLNEDIDSYLKEDSSPIDEIDEADIIEAFRSKGLSADHKENPLNDIVYDSQADEITVTYTSYAFGGEMPKKLSEDMQEISDSLGAINWTFWEPMNTVRFFFE